MAGQRRATQRRAAHGIETRLAASHEAVNRVARLKRMAAQRIARHCKAWHCIALKRGLLVGNSQ